MRRTVAALLAIAAALGGAVAHAGEPPPADVAPPASAAEPAPPPGPSGTTPVGAGEAAPTDEAAAAADPAAAAPVPAGPAPLAVLPPQPIPSPLPPKLAPKPPRSWAVPAVEAAMVQLLVMGWNVWPGEAAWSNVSLDSIETNATSPWVIDNDEFYTNQLLHPYQGSFAFSAARSAGLGFWASVPYAFFSSLAWEVAGETEQPSINDQITTTIGGAVFGELAHRFSEALRAPGASAWRSVPGAILSPFSAINAALLGRPPPPPREPGTFELTLGAETARVPGPDAGTDPAWSSHGRVSATIQHGVPWHPDLDLEGPFDHYRLELGYAGSEDLRFTFLLRALLAGRANRWDAWRGASGLFVLLDIDTPGDFRVGTVGLGLGHSGGVPLGRGLALEATAVAAAVPMAAIGTRPPVVENGRNYRFGPGAQGLAEIALTARERASLRLGARGVAVVGTDGVDGREAVGLVRAQALVRVFGSHGLGVEASLAGRRVAGEEGAPDRSEVGRAVQVFYSLSRLQAPGGDAGEAGRLAER